MTDSCYFCHNARFFSDESVGIPLHLESCAAADSDLKKDGVDAVGFPSHIGDLYGWNEDIMPKFCGNYKPIMAGFCMVCKKEIDSPAHEWPLNGSDFMSGELYPVCSVLCYNKAAKAETEAAKEYDRYVEEMQKDWHKYQEKIVETERCATN